MISARSSLTGRRGTTPALALALLLALLLVPLAAGSGRSDAAPVFTAAAPDNYSPHTGVRFNHPLIRDMKKNIIRHIARSLNSAPTGSRIRIASWNIKSEQLVDSTIRAHRRGVGVRVIMAKSVADRQRRGGAFDRLKSQLARGNGNRGASMKSWARTCKASCRGFGGIAHTKMYLFSQAGTSTDVVMAGSANMTGTSGSAQWNDIFTVVGRSALFAKAEDIFNQMARDRKALQPYQTFDAGPDIRMIFYPYRGGGTRADPVVRELSKVRCTGVTGGAGNSGRTVIRIAQTGILGDHGRRVADKLRQLHRQGCNIRIIYAVSERSVRTRLGGIPVKQYVQDTNGDGVYDRYLHMKSMSISGVYDGNTNARVVFNGSANWSPKALNSDEAGFRVHDATQELRYRDWINRLWENPPRDRTRSRTMAVTEVSPIVRVTKGGRVIGSAVLPDGTTINPYEKIQLN